MLFISFNKIHVAKYLQVYCFIFILALFFCFLLFVSKLNMRFCHKNFLLPIVSRDHWTLNRKSVTDEKFSTHEYVNSCSSSIVKSGGGGCL